MTPPDSELALCYIHRSIRALKSFAKKHEYLLMALCLTYIKNRRKRPFHLGIIGLSVFLLMLLYDGGKKEIAKRLGVSRETIREWLIVASVGKLSEIEKIDKEVK